MMAEWICKKRFSVPDVVLGGIEINVGDRFADVEWNRHDHFNIPKIYTVFRWINPSCDPESDESDVPYFIGIHPDDVNKLLRRNNGEDVGKPIEKHYCKKCVHGILCESGELKCNHEAWTTTKDGAYAYPNGLRQIKSRDKPSWCPGFKAMQSAGCDEVKKTNAEIGLDKKECEKNSGIFYLTNRIIYELSQISPTSVGPDNSFRLGKCVAMAAEIQRINKENKK